VNRVTQEQLARWKHLSAEAGRGAPSSDADAKLNMEFHNCSLEAVRALCAEVEWLQDRIKTMQGETLPPDEWFESVLSSLDDLNAWGERIGLGKWLENFEPEVRKNFVMLAEDAGDLIRGLLRRNGNPGLIAKVFTHQRFHDLRKHPGPPATLWTITLHGRQPMTPMFFVNAGSLEEAVTMAAGELSDEDES
jgi:hypothetical protein